MCLHRTKRIPVPLVIMLHGKGESGVLFEGVGMDSFANRDGFITVYPDALGYDRSWNDGGTGSWAEKNNTDDVGFVSALIDHLKLKTEYRPQADLRGGDVDGLDAGSSAGMRAFRQNRRDRVCFGHDHDQYW